MKSSINVRYHVYAPKAERNSVTHLNARTVYPLGSKSNCRAVLASQEQMHSVTRALNSAVRSSVKHLNSGMNSVIV